MVVPDYTIFYKKKFSHIGDLKDGNLYDLFISAYNDSDRVRKVFDIIQAKTKHWLLLPEYNYSDIEVPANSKYFRYESGKTESEVIVDYVNHLGDISNLRICLDITGFMRPHLIFLLRYFLIKNIKSFDAIYTDPEGYTKKEKTTFTKSMVENVRQVALCEGRHDPDNSNDVLIIGSGYDYQLIASVAESKASSRIKVQVFGFPSLQPDMYQESLLNAYRAQDSIEGKSLVESPVLFAPANDPFVTASVLHEYVNLENSRQKITNLYLSPLATKVQTLGFALYFIWECLDKPVSIIFPFCAEYSRETSFGVARVWKYSIHLP